MRGICPECRQEHPVDADDRMTDHKDPHGAFACVGVGMDCGMVLKEKKNHGPRFKDLDPHEDQEDDSHQEDDADQEDDACCFVPTCDHGYSLPEKNEGIFGSVGSKILDVSDLSVFDSKAKKLTQKERKARAK